MGYIRHHAIVVTSWDRKALMIAAINAVEMGLTVLGPGPATINGYISIMVAPDGSKEGWEDSDKGDLARAKFRAWLASQRYEDGSNALAWVEIQFGPDDRDARVTHHEWAACREAMGEGK